MATTRKMLSRIPEDQYEYKPHEKSMNIRSLASHIAELPSWLHLALNTEELDFATSPYQPEIINNNAQLMAYAEKNYETGKTALQQGAEDSLEQNWKLRDGETIYVSCTRADMIRTSLSQIIHHRAQLGVYLRLLNVPIPGSYGPSADDMSF